MVAAPLISFPQTASADDWFEAPIADPAAPHLILVVDDSRMQRKLLTTSLRKWGYDVMESASGQEALHICRDHDVSIVLSDWVMPGMDGPEFCNKFRKLDRDGYGYFILLTSKSETQEVTHGLNSGADDFLTKPVNFGELKARLRAGERVVTMHAQVVEKNRMVNEALNEIQTLYDGLDRDLKEARNLQQSLVRETDIRHECERISLVLQPSGHVGGDLVGQFRINEDQIAVYSLDVSGHGVSSALLTARLAAYFSSLSPQQNVAIVEAEGGGFIARDPSETAAHLNDILLREMETEHYFTLALAILDEKTGYVRYVQAGHPHPILRRKGQAPELSGAGGPPIGLLSDVEFLTSDLTLNSGDRLILHSDGITECADTNGSLLDEDGLLNILERHASAEGPELLMDIQWELQHFSGSKDFTDDVSALVLDYHGPRA